MEWVKEAMGRKIGLFGEEAVLCFPEETVTVRAIIAPVRSVSQAARTAGETPDGIYPPGSYEYFGPPEADITRCRWVTTGGKRYYVRRSEVFRLGGTGIYCWGLMIGGGDGSAG